MKTQRIGENLIQITRMAAFNCFLVREPDGFTLIDAGLSGTAEAIIAAARQERGAIGRIALTHPHSDHVGSLDALVASLPDVEVIATERAARQMCGDLDLEPGEPQTPVRGGWPSLTTRVTRTVGDGDRVGSLEVVASPGHTPGHAAFLDRRDGTLIAGDAYSTQWGTRVSGHLNPLFPFPAMATWHNLTALNSARRLRALHPDRLAVGHGPVLSNPRAAMDAAIEAAARRWEDAHNG